MTQKKLFQQTEIARCKGGVFNITELFGILKVGGEDRILFLNNLLTINISLLKKGQVRESLILNPQAIIQFWFWIWVYDDNVILLTYKKEVNKLKDYLEQRLFVENVTLKLFTTPLYYFEKSLPDSLSPLPHLNICEANNITWIRLDCSGDEGYLIWGDIHPPLFQDSKVFSLLVYEGLNPLMLKMLRGIESRLYQKIAAMELPHWEKYFTFDMECYPGQEIITRSRSRNQTPARKYVPFKWLFELEVSNDSISRISQIIYNQTDLKTKSQILGKVISTHYSPKQGSLISWGYIQRDFVVLGYKIPISLEMTDEFDCGKIQIEILEVPAPQTDHNAFQKAMDAGLNAYHGNNFATAKKLFTQAATLDPNHPDPSEALAMIEEKNGNFDSAIRHNKIFAEKSPDSPLAKTNLSRLYMLKGWIEKAEEEKRKAMVLMFKSVSREKKLEKEQVEIAQLQKVIKKKKKIFREVLKIDPLDEIANFGLGKLFFEEGNYHEAEGYFQQTLESNSSYSLAYSFLAECLIKKGDRGKALILLKNGIEQARKQGHMIPLRSMEESLQQLIDKNS